MVDTTFITSYENDRQLCRLLSYRQTDLRTHHQYNPQLRSFRLLRSKAVGGDDTKTSFINRTWKSNQVTLCLSHRGNTQTKLCHSVYTATCTCYYNSGVTSTASVVFIFYFLTLFSFFPANSLKLKSQSEQSLSSTDLSSFLTRTDSQRYTATIGTMDTYGPSDEFRQLSDCLVCPSP